MEGKIRIIEESYFEDYDIIPDDFIKKCKDNSNEAQFLPIEVKNNMKLMAMEKILYSEVIKLRQKDSKLIAANNN